MTTAQEPLETVGRRIVVTLDNAARDQKKADEWIVSAAQSLAEAHQRIKKTKEMTWLAFLKTIKLDKSRSYELLQIAAGKKTPAEIRAATAARDKKRRAKAEEFSAAGVGPDDTPEQGIAKLRAHAKRTGKSNFKFAKVSVGTTDTRGITLPPLPKSHQLERVKKVLDTVIAEYIKPLKIADRKAAANYFYEQVDPLILDDREEAA